MRPFSSKRTHIAIVAVCLAAPIACSILPGVSQTPAGDELSATQPAADATLDIHCTETDPHPIGQNIADTYEIPYEQVMSWFCEGYSFENILVALETSSTSGIPADELLQKLLDKSWDEIWNDIGFSGSS